MVTLVTAAELAYHEVMLAINGRRDLEFVFACCGSCWWWG
jgi:hypothetical protein